MRRLRSTRLPVLLLVCLPVSLQPVSTHALTARPAEVTVGKAATLRLQLDQHTGGTACQAATRRTTAHAPP